LLHRLWEKSEFDSIITLDELTEQVNADQE